MEQLREAEAWAPQLLALLAFSASSCTLRPETGREPGSGGSGAKTYFPKKDLVWGKEIIVSFPYKPTSDPHIFFVLGRFPDLVGLPCSAPNTLCDIPRAARPTAATLDRHGAPHRKLSNESGLVVVASRWPSPLPIFASLQGS